MYDINRRGFRKPFPYKYFYVTFWLIGINVLVFLLAPRIPLFSGQISLFDLLLLHTRAIRSGFGYWGIFTYMFAHGGFSHLFFNMLALLIFGLPLEQRMGSWEFLVYYLLTGILVGLSALGIYLTFGMNASLLGASGAIYAVLLAFATYYPYSRIYIFGLIPIRAPVLVLIYLGMEIFGILRQLLGVGGQVSHLAHLSGLLFGFLYLILRIGINPIKAFSFKNRDNEPTNYF